MGKTADLVLLDDNPLLQITQRIRAVILDGRLFDRADVDALLDASGEGFVSVESLAAL